MINKEDILFVTTSLFTESQKYQKKQLEKFFPQSEKIIIDGTTGWFDIWYKWIDIALNKSQEWIIHLDEDCFILNDEKIINHINYMIENNFDISGCPDGFHEYRSGNYIALNSFFMILNKKCLLNWKKYISTNNEYPQFKEEWLFEYPYEKKNKTTILKNQEWNIWIKNSEPYYNFMWVLKEMGIKFNYIEPIFGEDFFCTYLLDNGILHAWHVRQINENNIISNLHNITNKERFIKIFKFLENEK
jgi:hypothetical protein